MNDIKKYDWAIVGGGIAGIALSEILTREGHSVVLIEKNNKLASQTTRDFHEWIHTGALYTLIPDKLITLKFILGAIDDLIEYYSAFDGMNLIPTNSGLKIDDKNPNGWFYPNYIYFKYRIKNRKITFPWLFGVARSLIINDRLKQHDWLRRRAGELEPIKNNLWLNALKKMISLLSYGNKFYNYKTTDFCTHSRKLLIELVNSSMNNGLKISLSNEIRSLEKKQDFSLVVGNKETFKANKVAVCAGSGTGNFAESSMKTSYAPIAIVEGVGPEQRSFVELDYFPKNCINILTKQNGVGLIGGISLDKKEKCEEYLNYVISAHKKLNPNISVLGKYIGKKNEIVFKNQNRNYLYNINKINEGTWSIIPGKFTLGFSLAPEFYRQVYNKNPKKHFKPKNRLEKTSDIIANTVWHDVQSLKKERTQGNDKITP